MHALRIATWWCPLLIAATVIAQEAAKLQEKLAVLHKQLKTARDRTAQADDAIAKTLTQLAQRTVTVDSLHKTQVGATVNKLRRHEGTKIAEASQALVRQWKQLVERGDRTGAKIGQPAQPQSRPAASPAGGGKSPVGRAAASGSGGERVLDSVRDEHGRMERRLADPDSHEDQLALKEAAEAERMWAEKMEGGLPRGTSGGGRLEAAAVQLKSKYEQIEAEKKRKHIVAIDPPPAKARRPTLQGHSRR